MSLLLLSWLSVAMCEYGRREAEGCCAMLKMEQEIKHITPVKFDDPFDIHTLH